MHYNIKTQAKRARLPSVLIIDGQIIRDPTPDQYDQAGWRPFVPAENPYMIGDRVRFEGQIWESTINDNVWSPATFPAGWEVVE